MVHLAENVLLPPLRPCRIFVRNIAADTGLRLANRYVPGNWVHNQYAVEWYLQKALLAPWSHPWVVDNSDAADVVFVAANFSMMCLAGKSYSIARLWKRASETGALGRRKKEAWDSEPPLFVPAQYAACPLPIAGPDWEGSTARSVIVLRESASVVPTDRRGILGLVVSPFVVSRPAWLVGATSDADKEWPPENDSWRERKLLFTAGHVPKLYLRSTRYLIWRQLRRNPRVTTLSGTLACTVGAYSVCRRDISVMNQSELKNFCHGLCGRQQLLGGTGHGSTRSVGVKCLNPAWTSSKMRDFLQNQICPHYRSVDFDTELPDMIRDTRQLGHADYLREAKGHRFCLVAPGDFVSSHKIAEAIAIGASGGCVPVFVLPEDFQPRARARHGKMAGARPGVSTSIADALPYTRWLDYCEIAYFIREETARTDFGALLLPKLEAIREDEARRKMSALASVRDAFVFRAGSSVERPSGTEYVLNEMCASARRYREERKAAQRDPALFLKQQRAKLAGGDHLRCLLG
jgi:hypothetical protein